MVRHIPCFLAIKSSLSFEELLTSVEPWEGILLAITHCEGELVRVYLQGGEGTAPPGVIFGLGSSL